MFNFNKYYVFRKTGLMNTVHHKVQHMNPACRACRYFPSLPSSRLLMSLNDWDVSEGWDLSKSVVDHLFGWLGSIVTISTYLPPIWQDFVVEILIAAVLNLAIVVVYLIISFSVVLFFMIILIMVGLFFMNEILNWYRRYKFRNQVRPQEDSSDSDEDDEDMKKFKIVKKKKKPSTALSYKAAAKPQFDFDFEDLFPEMGGSFISRQKPRVQLKDVNNKIHSSALFSGVMNSLNSVPAAIVSPETYSSLVTRKSRASDRKRRMRVTRVSIPNSEDSKSIVNTHEDPVLEGLKALSEYAVDGFFDYYRGARDPFESAAEGSTRESISVSVHSEHDGNIELMMKSMEIGELARKRFEKIHILYPETPETEVEVEYSSIDVNPKEKRIDRSHRKRLLRPKAQAEEKFNSDVFESYSISKFIVEYDQIPIMDIFEEAAVSNDDTANEHSVTASSSFIGNNLQIDEESDLSDND